MKKAIRRNCFTRLAAFTPRVCAWAILVLAILAVSNSAQAAVTVRTWDGGGGDANWGTGANWDNNAVPAANEAVSFASSFGTGGTTISLGASSRTTDNLQITTTTDFSLNNNTLTISTGEITRSAASGTTTINSAVAIANDGVWNVSGNLTVAGVVSGKKQLDKTGTGTVTLGAANDFTKVTVTAGVIKAQNSSALGSGDVDIVSGAAVQIDGTGLTIGNKLNTLDSTGIAGDGGIRNLSGNNTWSGSVSLGADARINSDAGTLTFNSATELDGHSHNLTFGGSGNVTVSTVMKALDSLTKDGSGTLTLSGANKYAGPTTVKAGTLLVGANAPNNADGALGHATSAVLVGDTSGSSDASLLTGGAFTVGRAVTVQAGSSGVATLGGNTASVSAFSGAVTLNKSANLTAASGGTVTFSGVISGTGSGITKVGPGTVILSGANTYTGGTTLSAGTLRLGADNVIPNTGTFAFSGGNLDANDKSEVMGGLSLTANSAITLGTVTARQDLTFASAARTGGQLTVDNWVGTPNVGASATADRIIFNSNANTGGFLSNVFWNDQNITGATFISIGGGQFELVPVPEPGTILAGCLLVGIFGWSERKRLRRLFPIGVRN